MSKCRNCVRFVHVNDDGEQTLGRPNWCFYLSDSPDEDIDRDCKVYRAKTNADRIRAMSDDELARYFGDLSCHKQASREVCIAHERNCEYCWLDWLKQEAT